MINAKKSLGQNFLKSQAALRSIITAGNISPEDIILEIGPGTGVLTEKILEALGPQGKLIVIEKDDRLIPELQEKFADAVHTKKLEIIHADVLEFNPSLLKQYGSSYKLIANIPYYITGAIIRNFLSTDFQPERMVLLVQKEVAVRIVARDGKESLLSQSVKAYGTPKYIETVHAKYFSPRPKVDSAILLIEHISKKFFTEHFHALPTSQREDYFFEILKAGFAHKRKILIGNLKNISEKFPDQNLETIFNENEIGLKVRAEDMTLNDWKNLIERLK